MPLPLRVVYMGSPDFAVPSLAALIERTDLAKTVALVTQTDKPTGRGQALSPPPTKALALEHDIPVLQPKTLKDEAIQNELRALQADLFVVAAYGKILPQAVLDIPRLGCVNLHASLLPRHRGAAPIAHALLAGDVETGVCLMRMEAGLDTGPVYARVSTTILEEDNAGTLTDRLAQLGAELLVQSLPALADGALKAESQPDAGATYANKLKKEDGAVDWSLPAEQLWQRIRAYSPWPSAFTFVDGRRLQILAASLAHDTQADPGAAIVDGTRLFVGCGKGALEILEVKPEGKRAMAIDAYLAGRPFASGHLLGRKTLSA
jgi:methionyl-tRNA formyltransferase